MPDILNENGLQVKTRNELVTELTSEFQNIYGNDINVEQNSPDGQIINIFSQAGVDIRELITEVYNSFNPNVANGIPLRERTVINNVIPKAATYTLTPISITVDRTVTLSGLDADFNNPNGTGFTVQDDNGNQFILVDTTTLNAGTSSLSFRASNIGRVLVTTNTITNPVTSVIGVTGVNNPSGATQIGQDEETDNELKIRRERSTATGSQSYLNGIQGKLLNLDGVTEAIVFENDTNTTDSRGIPPHSLWAIVEGGANADIANIIYGSKTGGSGTFGAVTVDVTTPSGQILTLNFDRPEAIDLHIRFNIRRTTTGFNFDENAIKAHIVNNLTYNIGDDADSSQSTEAASNAILANGGGGVALNVEISNDGTTFTEFLQVANSKQQWTLSAANIDITVI